MFKTRKLKFHNGKVRESKEIYMVKTNLFTSYMIKLCDEANKVTKTKFIGVTSDEYNDWIIKIRTKNKAYFNLIAQKFVNEFDEVISQVKY